ncbi:MAG: hypothetical protein ACRCU5_00545 [Rhizobiaceae bacterium]
MIREISVEVTDADQRRLSETLGAGQMVADVKPGRRTFTFDDNALTAIAGDRFERFLWTSFDRVEEVGGSIVLAKEGGVTFFLPLEKLQDPTIRRAIFDYVTGRVAVQN